MVCGKKKVHSNWNVIMRYIRIYKALLVANMAHVMAYKKHFVSQIISSLGWGLFSIMTILLLTSHVTTVFGWTRNELIFLTVMVNVIYGTYRALFDTSFWSFSQVIHSGQLDSVLLKPVDSQFQMSAWHIDFSGVIRMFISIGLAIYLVHLFNFQVTILSLFVFLILSITSIILLYSITFSVLTIIIWFSKLHNLYDLINTGMTTSKYPKEMYAGLNGFLFFILLPMIIIISTPTKALLQKGNIWDSALLIAFAIICFTFSRFFWKFALRFYTSASG